MGNGNCGVESFGKFSSDSSHFLGEECKSRERYLRLVRKGRFQRQNAFGHVTEFLGNSKNQFEIHSY